MRGLAYTPPSIAAAAQLNRLRRCTNQGGSFLIRNTSTVLRIVVVLGAMLLLAAAPARVTSVFVPSAAAAVGDCSPSPSWGTSRADFASQVVSLVNQHRNGMGLNSLTVSPTLTNAAVWKAMHMAGYGYMAHDDPAPPVARTVGQRLAACGYPSSTSGWGENIAYGYSTPAAVMNAWLNSPGHRANIENGSYRVIGVGAAANANGTLYWSQEFGTFDDSGGGSTGSSPTVSLTSVPAASTTSTSATFAWTTSGLASSTTCSLDNGTAVMCSSPWSYSGVSVGTHAFRVTVGNSYGSSSGTYNWTVTAPSTGSPPTVSIVSGPAASTTSTSANFSWNTSGTVTSTTCALDGGVAVSCVSPRSYSGLATGSHTFVVRVGNGYGGQSATYGWTITSSTPPPTTGAPKVAITTYPPSLTHATSATFAWSTTGSPTSTTCRLDASSVPCSSPWTYSLIPFGTHAFTVTVANASGSSSASYIWRIY